MKKHTFFLIFLIFSFLAIDAQESYIKGRWNVKVGYAKYPGAEFVLYGRNQSSNNFRIETSYGLFKFLEIGGYFGYSRTIADVYNPIDSISKYVRLNTLFLGLTINVQLLSLLVKESDFRFDLYVLGRYGCYYFPAPENSYPKKGFYPEIKHGAGLAFYLTKHIGLYTEYSFGNLLIGHGVFRYGLSLKF